MKAWREDGTWERLHDGLRREVRVASGRNPDPSAGAIDTQSVRTGGKKGAVTATTQASKSLGVSAVWPSTR